MASKLEFVEYVCQQLSGAGEITYKKMFGEYGLYCDGKPIGVVCDDQLFIKKTAAGAAILPGCPEQPPYAGAKPSFLIEELDNHDLMARFIRATYEELPLPKPRKKKA